MHLQAVLNARQPGLLAVAVAVLVLAAVTSVLSFTRLDGKVYWHDEAYSSLRVFGHTGTEYHARMFDGKVHTVAELEYYQHADPDLGLDATLRALASRPEHSPLYYLLARLWSVGFSDPVVALRSLAAVFGVLLLPAVFWLAQELFKDPRVSWVAVALSATSPLHLLYAQEERQYALWSMLVVLSGAALLHALRRRNLPGYCLYATTAALGLYAHILFAFTLLAQAIYLVLMRHEYSRGASRGGVLSLLFAAVLFVPWIRLFINAIPDIASVTRWMQRPAAMAELVQGWLASINRVFFDFRGAIFSFHSVQAWYSSRWSSCCGVRLTRCGCFRYCCYW